MNKLVIEDLPIAGLKKITRKQLGDSRGFLSRLFCNKELESAGWGKSICQINHTYTQKKGTVRGLHFQYPPYSEVKLVNCLKGEIWDIAVDLRQGSPTFLQWHAEKLSANNQQALLIPEGCAHGFQALSDECELLYLHDMPYNPRREGGVNIEDPLLNIKWPLPITKLSDRDKGHTHIPPNFTGLTIK